ncbi:hypothetical protein SADUNF_Sadunf01G0132100 [Salix dunnii]|uniref:Uncharacterized protein n=1 Tax=Salix dunnii TaxID=1413687 RepID=A0A835NC42_9ROSI|nr:hypothetical protein SADUNF_Sadunf01G0132100 [Salix dunnii]
MDVANWQIKTYAMKTSRYKGSSRSGNLLTTRSSGVGNPLTTRFSCAGYENRGSYEPNRFSEGQRHLLRKL